MSQRTINYSNKTSLYLFKTNTLFLIGGLPGYIKWRESGYTQPLYRHIQSILTIFILLFVAMEVGAFVTQKSLSEKQAGDLMVMGLSHPVLCSYQFIIVYHKERLRELLYKLCISLKNVYNDPDIERQMIKKATRYSAAFMLNVGSALFSYGYDGLSQAIHTDGCFVTVITAWPDVTDESTLANVGRVVGYAMWWVMISRVIAVFILMIITTGCLSYQYKNLQSYFNRLNDIFYVEGNGELDQENAEKLYEEGFKVGIKAHAETLWCARECQAIYSIVYSVQIMLNVTVIAVLMSQMAKSERTLGNTLKIMFAAVALLSGTGILMWNAGDATVEAAFLPSAMYNSGWQRCVGRNSQRTRKLLVIAMRQAQRPVVMRSFGVMEMSYQAFVSIVKASYSAFSLLY